MRALVLLAFAVSVGDIDVTGGWSTYATKDGITLERRKPDDSRFYEHRAVVDLPRVDPAVAEGEIWKALRGGDMDSLKHRDVLKESADELVIYDQIHTPVVSDRDYTIVVRRHRVGTRMWFDCATANDRGPPPNPKFVRIGEIHAGWYVEPNGHGGTRLGYFAFSEPGGSVPAWLVRGAQADRSMADVARMVKRLGGR